MAGRPISVGEADDMIREYNTYMSNLGVEMEQQTQNVSFTGSILLEWLVNVIPHSDEIKIFMGAYPEGRTTVLLWPYKNAQPAKDAESNEIEPFNDGALSP
jgi:hypothetical protein